MIKINVRPLFAELQVKDHEGNVIPATGAECADTPVIRRRIREGLLEIVGDDPAELEANAERERQEEGLKASAAQRVRLAAQRGQGAGGGGTDPDGTEGDGTDDDVEVDLEALKVDELRDLLAKHGVEVPDGAKKADLVNLAEGALA